MIWDDLTARQREAAVSCAAITLVTGGAGTGKTTAALWAARRTLEADDAESWERVLFLTFSRTAVDQIATRSSRVGGLEHRIEISTFHAFAMRILRAFGAYAGRGRTLPSIQSEAQRKLFGVDPDLLTYDELVPAAIAILRSSRPIRELAARRWPVIICDEFQDTGDDQWELLTLLGETGRLILLADPNQMIYTFVRGVGPERLRWARDAAQLTVELEEASHRDPTGVIPAMASAVRIRRFEDVAVQHAVDSGALRVRTATDDQLIQTVVEELRVAREGGSRSVGLYGHSNEGVARLGAALTGAGVAHTLVGIPEAQAEGLASLLVLTDYAYTDATEQAVRIALATFLTACVRGASAPDLAIRLAYGRELPRTLAARLDGVLAALRDAAEQDIGTVSAAAAGAWDQIGITAGVVPWRRAAYGYTATVRGIAARRLTHVESRTLLERHLLNSRSSALVTDRSARTGLITLMNFHQTKGREADAVQLIYRDNDYLANSRDAEPYTDPSRVLYVALTRARKAVTVILPRDPHPLVAPFREFVV